MPVRVFMIVCLIGPLTDTATVGNGDISMTLSSIFVSSVPTDFSGQCGGPIEEAPRL